MRMAFRAAGVPVVGTDDCPIVPVIVGEAAATLKIRDDLRAHGLLVPAIRPPTVPQGTSRLRISLSAVHERDDIERLVRTVIDAFAGLGLTDPGASDASMRPPRAASGE
jgi:8-amino-7-oxononanoate synthase